MMARSASISLAVIVLGWSLFTGFHAFTGSHAVALAGEGAEGPIEATVTRTIDGDSLDARVSDNRTAVGYLGAEAPPANQPCGQEALARNQELADSQVLLMQDPAYDLDERGRRLFYAYTADGRSIEELLIREGLARAVRLDGSRGPELAALQAEAESAGRGCLWGG
jgi:endonuclease YncB( thermonuclease family)